MTELMNMTDNILDIVLKKEEDYYSYLYKKIKNNNDILYSSNVLANNLLHIDFNNYVYDEIINILNCAIKLITNTIDILNDKKEFSKEDIKTLDFATIQIIDIYSDILIDFMSDEEYMFLKELRKYTNIDEKKVSSYLEKNYNNSELIKLIYVYVLLKQKEINKAKDIYKTYKKIEKEHPFYHLGNNIHKIIEEMIN